MGDMIRCAKCGTYHYRNDPCPDSRKLCEDVSRQCNYVADNDGGYLCCALEIGHDGPHRTSYTHQQIERSWLTVDDWIREYGILFMPKITIKEKKHAMIHDFDKTAFPSRQWGGLTIRQYAAIEMAKGLCAEYNWASPTVEESVAARAVKLADAVLAASTPTGTTDEENAGVGF